MLYIDPSITPSPLVGQDIFKILADHATNFSKDAKSRVKGALKIGRAISVDVNLWLQGGTNGAKVSASERFVTHWTPMKDEESRVKYVVLCLASKGGE